MALDKFSLPNRIVSQGDVARVKRELHSLNDYLDQAQLRKTGSAMERLPKTSRGLDDFVTDNTLNLVNEQDRYAAISFFDELADKAPVVHVSFAVDPSANFIIKITGWFRENIDRLVLVNIGLEPTIAAGCTVRTDNHLYDFSLRSHFDKQRQLLISKIKGEPTKAP